MLAVWTIQGVGYCKLFPSCIDLEGSGKWGLGGNDLHFQSGVVEWGGIKVKKVEKVGFAVHRASFVFF